MGNTFWHIWLPLAAVAAVTDWTMNIRRLAGRQGEQSRAELRASIEKVGGIRWYILLVLCGDIVVPPLALAGCAFVYLRDQKRKAGLRK